MYNNYDSNFDRNLNVMNNTLSRIIDKFYTMISATVNPYQSKVDSITEMINSFDDFIASDEVDENDKEYYIQQKIAAKNKLEHYMELSRSYEHEIYPAFKQFDQVINHNQDLLNYTLSGMMSMIYDAMRTNVNPYQSKVDSITEIINSYDKLIDSDEVETDAKEYYRQQKTVAEKKLEHYVELSKNFEPVLEEAFKSFKKIFQQNQNLLYYFQSMFTVSKLEDDNIITSKTATKLDKRLAKKYPIEEVDLSDMLENIDEDDYLKIDTEDNKDGE